MKVTATIGCLILCARLQGGLTPEASAGAEPILGAVPAEAPSGEGTAPFARHTYRRLLRLEEAVFRSAADRASRSVVRLEWVGGQTLLGETFPGGAVASGLVVASQGWIVTSTYFFVEKPEALIVRFTDGQISPGRILGRDFNRMVTLVKVDRNCEMLLPEPCPPTELRVGMWTIAIGWTISDRPHLGVGILSARNRIWGKGIQTDTRTSPLNYGGPLIDIYGRVIGVIVPFSPDGKDPVAGVEWHDSGIGFAVRLSDIQDVLPRLAEGRDLFPGKCGVSFAHQNPVLATPVIASVDPRSPADLAGLKPKDRLVQAAGRAIRRASDFYEVVHQHYGGDEISVLVEREGKIFEVQMQLAPDHEPLARVFRGPKSPATPP